MFAASSSSSTSSQASSQTSSDDWLPSIDPSESPLGPVSALWDRVQTVLERRALLNYLLYYQHYNAEYTTSENTFLSYPAPLYAPEAKSGYIRTEFRRLNKITQTYVSKQLFPFMKACFGAGKKSLANVKLTTPTAIDVLKTVRGNEVDLCDLRTFLQRGRSADKRTIIQIEISAQELANGLKLEELLADRLAQVSGAPDLATFRKCSTKELFLFYVRPTELNCSFLWTTHWCGKINTLLMRCIGLEAPEAFGENTFSALNNHGAVPDRVVLNSMLTHELGCSTLKSSLASLGRVRLDSSATLAVESTVQWDSAVRNSLHLDSDGEAGIRLFRDAIQRWDDCFFSRYQVKDFAAPLLCSQVKPWMQGVMPSLKDWVKAYQNLCEVVMATLQAYPGRFTDLNLHEATMDLVDPDKKLGDLYFSTGLYPYAMAAISDVLRILIDRPSSPVQPTKWAFLGQNYFETLNLVETLGERGYFEAQKLRSIDELEAAPDVLVADIHPNNAAQHQLFQNNVAPWLTKHLSKEPNKRMVLVLDVTMNHFSDPVIQRSLHGLAPFIKEGRLEIFCVQSLAKLVQLGADNFSGGYCLYLGSKDQPQQHPEFPEPVAEKAAFFTLLTRDFPDISREYFKQVRENTDWMYEQLSQNFAEIAKLVTYEPAAFQYRSFCAAEVSLNGDDNAVYVAINFSPLAKLMGIDGDDEENKAKREELCKQMQQLFLDLAHVQGLPLTGRQSFGFSMTNMSGVVDAIRMSIGVENGFELDDYANLVTNVVEALSRYAAETEGPFEFEAFASAIRDAYAILNGHKTFPMLKTRTLIDGTFDDESDQVGTAEICVNGKSLEVNVLRYPDIQLKLDENDLLPQSFTGLTTHLWGDSAILRLIFRRIALDPQAIHVRYDWGLEGYSLEGVAPVPCLFVDYDDPQQLSGCQVIFRPEFLLTDGDKHEYDSSRVYLRVDGMGKVPIKLSRLSPKLQGFAFQRMVQENFELVPHKQDSVYLRFVGAKPRRNYQNWVEQLLKNEGYSRLVATLNTLGPDKLPMSHKHRWDRVVTPQEALLAALRQAGGSLAYQITVRRFDRTGQIESARYRKAIVEGLFDAMTQGAFQDTPALKEEQARLISEAFEREPLELSHLRYGIEAFLDDAAKREPLSNRDSLRLLNYLDALMPLIKRVYNQPLDLFKLESSVQLKKLAVAIDHTLLLQYLAQLENGLEGIKHRIDSFHIEYRLAFLRDYPLPYELLPKLMPA